MNGASRSKESMLGLGFRVLRLCYITAATCFKTQDGHRSWTLSILHTGWARGFRLCVSSSLGRNYTGQATPVASSVTQRPLAAS